MIKWIYCGVLIFLSAIAFAAYAIDKKKAKSGGWRISERTLLCLSFFACRHKTRKWYFHFLNLLGLCWQVAAAVVLFVGKA